MQPIVLFHSALGCGAGVHAFADRLRTGGRAVLTPDLFDGETFEELAAGVKKRDALGIPELMRRAMLAVADVPPGCIYAGFSMGAAAAQFLAQTRPGARAAVLMHGALPLEAMGAPWPDGTPLQIHFAESDPWVDAVVVDRLAHDARAEVHRYPGSAHLFTDRTSPEYDEPSAELVLARIGELLGRC